MSTPFDRAARPTPHDRLDALERENLTLRERLRWAELLLEIQAKTRQAFGLAPQTPLTEDPPHP